MRTRPFATPLIVTAGLCLAQAVFAVGGGGGGSVPTCNEDTWNCGGWGNCSAQGQQTRTCTLAYDCPTVVTPMPAETQSCTPPAAPPAPAAAPSCTGDVWTCGPWSRACDGEGNMSRNCTLTASCPGAATPKPATAERCDHLQCGDKPALRDRIYCRLNLAPAGVARELELQYLPEECRATAAGAARQACIARYLSFKPCWGKPDGAARFACAEGVLHLAADIPAAEKACNVQKKSKDRVACRTALRNGVATMTKFRFYDLEQRAEYFAGEGHAAVDAVADLDAKIELRKQAFNRARTVAAKQAIVRQVRAAWNAFLATIKDKNDPPADERIDYLDAALSDLRSAP